MESKGIIKNVKKFNKNIKLAKGVDLKLYTTKTRQTKSISSTGISTMTFGDKWFMTPKGKALFKTFDDSYGPKIRNVRIINELLCQELAGQVGLPCAIYENATYDGKNGLVTYDFAGDKKIVSLQAFMTIDNNLDCNLVDCAVAIDEYIDEGYYIDKKKVITDLYKLIVFDTLTMQTDRNSFNINFLYDNVTNEYTLAPMFDNEFAFCGERIMEWIKKSNKNADFNYVAESHSKESKIFTFEEGYYISSEKYRKNIEYIAFYSKKYPFLKSVLNDMLKKINPKLAFAKLHLNGNDVNSEYQEFVCNIIDNTKKALTTEKRKRVSKALVEDYEDLI